MKVIEIDGSAGEGGGQMLRSALALSMCTGQPFAMQHIRAGRAKPGLMRQHLACVNAAAEICGAQMQGAEMNSQALQFTPGPVRAGEYRFVDRKSTRLNSSHSQISYAVFCLKKKKTMQIP